MSSKKHESRGKHVEKMTKRTDRQKVILIVNHELKRGEQNELE